MRDWAKDTAMRASLYSDYFSTKSLFKDATTHIRAYRASEADMARVRASKVGLCMCDILNFDIHPMKSK